MPKAKSLKRLRKRASADTKIVKVDSVMSREGDLNLKISLPDGYHFSKEARSKYVVDVEPENAVAIDPMQGNLGPEGSTVLHFRQSSTSASVGKISCKVYYCKEDEVCLYQSDSLRSLSRWNRNHLLLRRSHSPLIQEHLMPVGYSFKLFAEPHHLDMICSININMIMI